MRTLFVGFLALLWSVTAPAKPGQQAHYTFGDLPVGAVFTEGGRLFQKMEKLVRTSEGKLRQVPDWSHGYFNAQWLDIPNDDNDGWRLLAPGGRDWWFADHAVISHTIKKKSR